MSPTARQNKWRLMKFHGAGFASILAIVAAVFTGATHAAATAAGMSGIAAKMQYCQDCHGISAQGYRGFMPIPRLAGQQPQYLINQLRAFIEGRRPNPIMSNVAHVLSQAMMHALAARFSRLNPPPLGGGPKRLAAKGRAIFQEGDPGANVAACAACHGPDAHGHDQVPRLAGQLFPYIVKALTNWTAERGRIPSKPDTSAVMVPIAHSLTRPQVEAVAAYLSTLR